MIRSRVVIGSILVPVALLIGVFLTKKDDPQAKTESSQIVSAEPLTADGKGSGKNGASKSHSVSASSSEMVETELVETGREIIDGKMALGLVPLEKVTHRAVANGMWSDPNVWGGRLPGPGARIHIPDGMKVTIDASGTPHLKSLRVDGELELAGNQDSLLHVDTLVINQSGSLFAGRLDAPVLTGVEVLLNLESFPDPNASPEERRNSALLVALGEVSLHGAPKTGMSLLSEMPQAGQKQIVLSQSPQGWTAGDVVVLSGNLETREDRPAFVVESVNGNVVTLGSSDSEIEKWGGFETAFDVDRNQIGFVVNTTRNVAISSPPVDGPEVPNGSVVVGESGSASLTQVGLYGLGVDDKLLEGQDSAVDRPAVAFEEGSKESIISGAAIVNAPASGVAVGTNPVIVENSVAYDADGGGWVTESGSPSRLVWPSERAVPNIGAMGGGK